MQVMRVEVHNGNFANVILDTSHALHRSRENPALSIILLHCLIGLFTFYSTVLYLIQINAKNAIKKYQSKILNNTCTTITTLIHSCSIFSKTRRIHDLNTNQSNNISRTNTALNKKTSHVYIFPCVFSFLAVSHFNIAITALQLRL